MAVVLDSQKVERKIGFRGPWKTAEDLTECLQAWTAGDREAGDRVMEMLYQELRAMARRQMRNERADHTLQPTALVHEAFTKLVHLDQIQWHHRAHFLGAAARTMRRVLVDHARGRASSKRAGGRSPQPLEDAHGAIGTATPSEVLAVHEALLDLAKLDERKARLVELRFFGGLEIEEAAEILDCSRATVIRQWRLARIWLRHTLFPEIDDDT